MYLRIIRCHLKEEAELDAPVDVFGEIMPAIEAYPGFKGASLMVNAATRNAVAFLYWASEEHASQAGEAMRPLLFDCTWDMTDDALDITGFHVVHHDVRGE